MKADILRRGLATTIMTISLGLTAMAQTPAPVVFGIGTGMTDPQGTLHIHSSELIENLEPLIPIGDGWRGGDSTSTRDGIAPPDGQNHYQTLLHMTNSTTGMAEVDGFSVKQYDNQVEFIQNEAADVRFVMPGGTTILKENGQVGLGTVAEGYRFTVGGKARFSGDVHTDQELSATGAVTVGTTLTVGTDASVYGGLAVGNGFACDNQGNVKAKRLKVTLTDWPDYVFGEGYRLRPLAEVEEYVKEHSHLPDVPSAAEVEAEGADLGEMNKVLLQKVEELTLYIIDLQRQINELKSNR